MNITKKPNSSLTVLSEMETKKVSGGLVHLAITIGLGMMMRYSASAGVRYAAGSLGLLNLTIGAARTAKRK